MAIEFVPFRPAKELNRELRAITGVYLDDELFIQAISFLSNTLNAGASSSSNPAHVPPPQHIALLATLAVHPSYTTRTLDLERHQAADSALLYLRSLSNTVSPVDAKLSEAFIFHYHSSRRGGRRRADGSSSPDDADGGKKIHNAFAAERALWAQVEDFWAVVGWIFNCSVREKKRWDVWRPWLGYMLDVMENDWAERCMIQGITTSNGSSQPIQPSQEDLCVKSIIAQYLNVGEGRLIRRRIMRAILADGGQQSRNEFKEVFPNETQEPKKKDEKQVMKIKKLDLDGDDFGDYGDEEDEDGDIRMRDVAIKEEHGVAEMLRPRRGRSRKSPNTDDSGAEAETPCNDEGLYGGTESISLRQRLLALLSQVSAVLPHQFTLQTDLFDLFTEHLRPLPLSTFSLFLSTLALSPGESVALYTNTLLPLLSFSANSTYNNFNLTQSELQKRFLPCTASSTGNVDNAKVGLLLEHAVMKMHLMGAIKPSQEFGNAVEQGINARLEKANFDARKKNKGGVSEARAKEILQMSSQRLLTLLEVIEAGANIVRQRPSLAPSEMPPQSSQMSELSQFTSEDEDDGFVTAGSTTST